MGCCGLNCRISGQTQATEKTKLKVSPAFSKAADSKGRAFGRCGAAKQASKFLGKRVSPCAVLQKLWKFAHFILIKNIAISKKMLYNLLCFGGIAQLGECLTGSQEVTGSSPVISIYFVFYSICKIKVLIFQKRCGIIHLSPVEAVGFKTDSYFWRCSWAGAVRLVTVNHVRRGTEQH